MDCPGFQIISYGVYDSRIALPRQAYSQQRMVARFELGLVTEDMGGIAYIDGKAYPLEKGMLICGKPGQLRYTKLPLCCHYVHIRTEDPVLKPALQALPDVCKLAEYDRALQIFRELAALPPISQADELQAASLVLRLLALVRQLTDTEQHAGISRGNRAMLMGLETYIRSNLTEDLSLETLAARAKFSPAHFHRIFTAFFGRSPHEFVLACRIEAAQAALRSDRCSLIELAAGCGFSSQSHFTAQFKKKTGMTPLQYRKQMLSRQEL